MEETRDRHPLDIGTEQNPLIILMEFTLLPRLGRSPAWLPTCLRYRLSWRPETVPPGQPFPFGKEKLKGWPRPVLLPNIA
jgi:hypothetical protein